ncbi:hypothetical protein ACJX0J_037736, partial [Zea mays]
MFPFNSTFCTFLLAVAYHLLSFVFVNTHLASQGYIKACCAFKKNKQTFVTFGGLDWNTRLMWLQYILILGSINHKIDIEYLFIFKRFMTDLVYRPEKNCEMTSVVVDVENVAMHIVPIGLQIEENIIMKLWLIWRSGYHNGIFIVRYKGYIYFLYGFSLGPLFLHPGKRIKEMYGYTSLRALFLRFNYSDKLKGSQIITVSNLGIPHVSFFTTQFIGFGAKGHSFGLIPILGEQVWCNGQGMEEERKGTSNISICLNLIIVPKI